MSTTLSDINSTVNDRRRDTTSNSIDMTTDGFRAVNGAIDIWNLVHDWPWQIEKTTITYNEGITVYDLPDRFKALVDIRPAKNESTEFKFVTNNSFDRKSIYPNRCAIRVIDGKQRMRLKYSGFNMLVHNLGSTSDNGTVTAGGDASNLTQDLYETNGSASGLKFDYDGTSGTITVTGMDSLDLTRYQDRSKLYMDIKLPSVTNFSSITLKIGNDASNYYSISATTDHLGESPVANEYTTIAFDWASASETGSVDITAMDYVQLTLAYGSSTTMTAVRIENLYISENIPVTIEYYTTNMVYDVSGTARTSEFNDSSATTDYPLFSGDWDYALEPFIDSILEYIFFMTGETAEMETVQRNISSRISPLKARLPSRRRYPEMTITTDTNL